jgi:diguanylate cyclase (GGDEF)-like protein
MIDIDHFKQINDSFGHDVGDYVLKKMARIFQDTARTYDVLGRIGGEEFLIFSTGMDISDARQFGERLRRSAQECLFDESGSEKEITVSVGVASKNVENQTLEQLLKAVDNALYKAKHNGRNRVEEAD